CNLRAIRESLGVKIFARDSTLKLVGEPDAVGKASSLIESLESRVRDQNGLSREEVGAALDDLKAADQTEAIHAIRVSPKAAPIRPKTAGQEAYVRAIEQSDLCFCLGPAGTGKTYIAVAMALSMLKGGRLKRIVLARPAVEAGEKLGYLPGDLQAKVNPYLRPLFDAMHDMLDFEQIRRFLANDVIEIVPLAFMRGRTLNNAAIILDEAQNATKQQMLMALTRLGQHSKMIVTGDDSQSDLDHKVRSGLSDAVERLEGIPGVAVARLGKEDIVRHRLVTEIVHAYGESEPRGSSTGQ
ncbi:MAG TPA: PhoH family protein, partial [Phycisphaerae bacterium]|nr:PhoH family protein [Phycisphaerae bacterium]